MVCARSMRDRNVSGLPFGMVPIPSSMLPLTHVTRSPGRGMSRRVAESVPQEKHILLPLTVVLRRLRKFAGVVPGVLKETVVRAARSKGIGSTG